MTASDPEVAEFLARLDAGFPDVTAYEAAEVRRMIADRRAPLTGLPEMARVTETVIDGPGGDLRLRVYRPHGVPAPGPAVVFAHGGGFVFCDLDTHDELCRSMADGVGATVVSVDYRLAPEHPAPAAHEDMVAAFDWTTGAGGAEYGIDPDAVVLAGDSAGGNLAATAALALRDRSGPVPRGQVLIYPVIDDDFATESYRRYGTGHYNTEAAMRWYWQQYAPDPAQRADPRVVPTWAPDLAGAAPAVVLTAELDPPCSSGDDYAARLVAAGVPVIHHRFAGLFHGFLTMPALAATGRARRQVWDWMRELIGAEAPR